MRQVVLFVLIEIRIWVSLVDNHVSDADAIEVKQSEYSFYNQLTERAFFPTEYRLSAILSFWVRLSLSRIGGDWLFMLALPSLRAFPDQSTNSI